MDTKARVNNKGAIRSFREGEIWWAAVGENVGVEIDGKSQKYSRPVVILRKYSNLLFAATPLTSKIHYGTWYMQFIFQGKMETAALAQTRPMDVLRLYERMGKLSRKDYDQIRDGYMNLFR